MNERGRKRERAGLVSSTSHKLLRPPAPAQTLRVHGHVYGRLPNVNTHVLRVSGPFHRWALSRHNSLWEKLSKKKLDGKVYPQTHAAGSSTEPWSWWVLPAPQFRGGERLGTAQRQAWAFSQGCMGMKHPRGHQSCTEMPKTFLKAEAKVLVVVQTGLKRKTVLSHDTYRISCQTTLDLLGS